VLDFRQLHLSLQLPATPSPRRGGCNLDARQTAAGLGERIAPHILRVDLTLVSLAVDNENTGRANHEVVDVAAATG
jgi:hypothetical protein